jgi:MoCo/4Fe-4S cofactor protein with predicted Tat translocation signal
MEVQLQLHYHSHDWNEFQEWLHREFPANASEFTDPVGRRHFLKIMGASIALAGTSRGIGADDIGLQGIPPEAPGLTNFQPAGYEQMGDANAAPEITSEYSVTFVQARRWQYSRSSFS